MNYTVIGANGMLGNYVSKYLEKQGETVYKITRKDLNIFNTQEDEVSKFLNGFVINCAGVIPQRNPKEIELLLGNSVFPHILSSACKSLNLPLVHITTDCVYDGLRGEYNEKDIHNANTYYGKSKSLGEPKEAYLIRTSPIGEELNNKVSLLEWAKSQKGKEIKGYLGNIWNGITCLSLAKYIYYKSKEPFYPGLIHLFGETLSKCELLLIINEVYDLNLSIIPVASEKCNRTLSSIYNRNYSFDDIRKQLFEQKDFSL